MRPLKTLKETRQQQNHYIITCESDLHLIDDIFMTGLRECGKSARQNFLGRTRGNKGGDGIVKFLITSV